MTGAHATSLALSRTASRAATRPTTRKVFEGQILFLAQPDHHESFCRNGIPGRREQKRLPQFADELAAISQRRKKAAKMLVRCLGRALIHIAGGSVFEEADDLQVGRLHIRANHLDGQLDAQRLRRKYMFLRR